MEGEETTLRETSAAETAKTLLSMPEISEAKKAKTLARKEDTDGKDNTSVSTSSDNSEDSTANKDSSDVDDDAIGFQQNVAKAPPSIKDQRTTIEQSEAMNDLFIKYAKITQQKFESLDTKGDKYNKANISSSSIVESSKETIVNPMRVFDDNPCKKLCELAKVPYKYGMSTIFYKDMSNLDVFISPLKHLILKSDRHTLKQAASKKIPDDQQLQGLSAYAFEVAYVNKISRQANRQIREQLFNFFTSVFDTREHEHIKDLLEEEHTKAAMLIDRSMNNNSGNKNMITTANLMGAVLFATDVNNNLLIDFVCAAPGEMNRGYGVFLIHVAQVFGMEIIQQDRNKNNKDLLTIPTYLSCNNDLLKLYTWLGFKKVPYKEFLSPNGLLKYFGKRMEISKWIEDAENIRLKCLCMRKWCPRWLSKIAIPALDIESSLYRQVYSRFKTIKTPKRISDLFKTQFENMLDNIKFRPIEQNDILKYKTCKNSTQFLQFMDKDLMVFKVGKMIKNCFSTESGILQPQTHSFSTSTIHALQYLEIRIVSQDVDESDLDKIGLWILV